MKKIISLSIICLTLTISLSAQKNKQNRDSITFYSKQLFRLQRQTFDSLRKSDQYISILNKIEEKNKASLHANYWGLTIFSELLHTDYGSFNDSISKNGFEKLNPVSFRLGIGITDKYKRKIVDFYFFVFHFANESKRGDDNISSELYNACNLHFGYDLLKSKKASLYPYGGLSLRFAVLRYSGPKELNPAYSDISDLIKNNPSINLTSFKLGYQLGLGGDLLISNNPNTTTYLFAKIATDNPFGRDIYKAHGAEYKPEIKHGDFLINLGFKLVNLR